MKPKYKLDYQDRENLPIVFKSTKKLSVPPISRNLHHILKAASINKVAKMIFALTTKV